MGRHSAPDDDEDDLAGGVDVLFADEADDGAASSGRHALRLVVEAPVEAAPIVTEAEPPATVAELPATARSTPGPPADGPTDVAVDAPAPETAAVHDGLLHRGAHASAADLALLRRDGALRARCIAAFLTPFVAYVIVLLVTSAAARTYLVWVWAPAILACVAAGAMLDVAHKRAGADAVTDR